MIIPYKNRIVVKPFKSESLLADDDRIIEIGEVLAVGEGVEWLKVGDVVYFDSYGCTKTAERNGEVYYTVLVSEETILGKETNSEYEDLVRRRGKQIEENKRLLKELEDAPPESL